MSQLPLISHISHYSIDDGPGIRSIVFFKGCPLSCAWCQNPECISPTQELAHDPRNCLACGSCVEACPREALTLKKTLELEPGVCDLCGDCAAACPSSALRLVGRHIASKDLAEEILENRLLFESSHGGVTFSGGEPTLHMSYLEEVLHLLKENGLHVAIETSGAFELEAFRRKLLPLVDLVLFDIKVFDPLLHRQYTGADNGKILHNLQELLTTEREKIRPRVLLVPGVSANEKNLEDIASFLKKAGCSSCDTIHCYTAARDKLRLLTIGGGMDLPAASLSPREEERLRAYFRDRLRRS